MNAHALINSVKNGDFEKVRFFIEIGVSPDCCNCLPVWAAAYYGHLDILNFLISKNGRIDDTALFSCLKNNKIESAKILLQAGANKNTIPRWYIKYFSEDVKEFLHKILDKK